MMNPFSQGRVGQTPDPSAYSFGQTQAAVGADERVRQALEATSWPYEISSSHNFRVIVNYTAEGRSQLVFIASATGVYRGREWRKVWSEAYSVTGRLPWDQALALLVDSDQHVFGAWYIEESDGNTSVYFQMSLPVDASPVELDEAILLVAEVADNKEKATVGTDAY